MERNENKSKEVHIDLTEGNDTSVQDKVEIILQSSPIECADADAEGERSRSEVSPSKINAQIEKEYFTFNPPAKNTSTPNPAEKNQNNPQIF